MSDLINKIIIAFALFAPDTALLTASEAIPPADKQRSVQNEVVESLRQEVAAIRSRNETEPRHKYIKSGSNRDDRYSRYIESWVKRIERVGAMNYPSAASALQESVAATVDVAVNADGSLHAAKVVKNSGNKEIDDKIETIIKLAAPFAPFPYEIRLETDILHITRQWKFSPPPNGFSGPK